MPDFIQQPKPQGSNLTLPKTYRKIGFGFVGLAVLAAALFILNSNWSKTTIIITAKTEKVSQELIFKIKEDGRAPKDDEISGKILPFELSASQTFKATGSKITESENVGEVVIYNNYSKDQTLIASTRLAAPDDLNKTLVRLKRTVVAPAGQRVKVTVYPDSAAEFKDLKPMKFVIPGLWEGLRDKIYAESEATLTKSGPAVGAVSEDDLSRAKAGLKDKIYQQAPAEADKQLSRDESLLAKLVSGKVSEFSSDAQAGEAASEFSAVLKLQTVVAVFDEGQVSALAKKRLAAGLDGEKQFLNLDAKSFTYDIQDFDLEKKEVTVKVNFSGNSVLSDPEKLFDKTKLIGLGEEEARSYFSQFAEIKSVEFKFSPAWLGKLPSSAEKIEIEVAK